MAYKLGGLTLSQHPYLMSSQQYSFNLEATMPEAADMRIGIVVSEWNHEITGKLTASAVNTLKECGVGEGNITVKHVPGSFELVYAAAQLAKSGYVDAIIAIGCVVRGDTPHFDYICQGTTYGISRLNATGTTPIIYGILTVNTMQQAIDRAGGSVGDKGKEFALTAIKMIDFAWQLQK